MSIVPEIMSPICDYSGCQYLSRQEKECTGRCEKLAHDDAVSLAMTGAQTSRPSNDERKTILLQRAAIDVLNKRIAELSHNLDKMVGENQSLLIDLQRWEHVKDICHGSSGGGMDDCYMVAVPPPKNITGCVSTVDMFVRAIDESLERISNA